MATPDQVARFHDPEYVAALRRAEEAGGVSEEDRARFRIGAEGNPVYAEIYRRPMTSAGGVMLAARLTAAGGIVHCPGGGTHHGRPARASGFCYLNDPVLGILTWLGAGLRRVAYLDIDAHHGDGVQDAFHGDERVLTISIHEAGRWPGTGAAEDRGGGGARNLPVPPGFNDTEMRFLMDEAVLPMVRAFRPEALFVQCGADALQEDPLAKLSLSNNAHWAVVEAAKRLAPRLVVTGGGGYNPWTVGRCWAGVWATLNNDPSPSGCRPRRRRCCGDCATTAPPVATRRSTGSRRCATRRAKGRCATRCGGSPTWSWRTPHDRSPLVLATSLLAPARGWAQQDDITGPQPELPKQRLVIVGKDGQRHAFQVEMALTPKQQEVGEMFRRSVPRTAGCCSTGACRSGATCGCATRSCRSTCCSSGRTGGSTPSPRTRCRESLAIIPSGVPVRATLEVAGGTAKRLGIVVGDKVLSPVFGTGPGGGGGGGGGGGRGEEGMGGGGGRGGGGGER